MLHPPYAIMADSLRVLQERFAAHIRDPDKQPAPSDVEDRRMAIYRDLFFRNISNFIARSFPVLRRLYSDTQWQQFMREFYIEHECHTPLFPEIPREFLQYLQEQRGSGRGDPPFLLELAHYEWVELALDLEDTELDALDADTDGDLMSGVPRLSPLAWPVSYRFPVHKLRPDYQPQEPPQQATHLLVYRDREDRVKFMQLNPVTARVLALLGEDAAREKGARTGQELMQEIAREMQYPDPTQLEAAGRTLLEDLHDRDVILGTRNTP